MKYPEEPEVQAFKGMHDRVREGKAPYCKWPRTTDGYLAFRKHIGPKPQDGQKWSLGRKDHSKGYERGNVRWELFKFNSVKRRGTKHEHSRRSEVKLNPGPSFERGSEGWLKHQSKASRARWNKVKDGSLEPQPRGWHGYYIRRETDAR